MFRTILAAVHESPRAPAVVATALALAERFDGTVHLFQVVNPPAVFPPAAHTAGLDLPDVLEHRARQELEALAAGHPRIVIEALRVDAHEPWRSILEEARQLSADLIVIGSHGYGGWDRLLGTIAAKVVDHADRAVLVVHNDPGEARQPLVHARKSGV